MSYVIAAITDRLAERAQPEVFQTKQAALQACFTLRLREGNTGRKFKVYHTQTLPGSIIATGETCVVEASNA